MCAALYSSSINRQVLANPMELSPNEQRAIRDFLETGDREELLEMASEVESSRVLLEALAHLGDWRIQKVVTENLATSPDLLAKLGVLHPESLLKNTAFLFEECFGSPFPKEFVRQIECYAQYRTEIEEGKPISCLSHFTRMELAREYANTVWNQYLSRDPHEEVRLALAENLRKHIPEKVAARLLRDPRPDVRKTLAGNRKLEASLYIELTSDPDLNVRRELAANPSESALEAHWKLLEQREGETLEAMAANQGIHPEVALVLATCGLKIRTVLGSNEALDQELVERLLGYGELPVTLAIANNTGTIEKSVCQLIGINEPEILEAVVANPKCPHLFLSNLAHQGSDQVHLKLLERPELPALIQAHLAEKGSHRVRTKLLVRIQSRKHRHNSPATRKVCQILATDPDRGIRISVLPDVRLGACFLEKRLKSASTEEQREIARNQALPVRQLQQLARSEDSITNHNALKTLLHHARNNHQKLAKHVERPFLEKYTGIADFICGAIGEFTRTQLMFLAGHRDTPFAVLGGLAQLGEEWIWRALLLRAFRYPFHLVEDKTGNLLKLPVKNRATQKFVHAHMDSPNPYIRAWIIQNGKLSDAQMAQLRGDVDPFVKYTVNYVTTHENPDTHSADPVPE